MKNRNFYRALFAEFVAVLVASVYSAIASLSRWPWLAVVFVSATGAFLLVYFSNNILNAVTAGLKRLPWIIFTAGLMSFGVMVGWTSIGFIFVYLLGVSASALLLAMAIASIFKRIDFGRELSDHILKGFLYAVAFMRLLNKQTKTEGFDGSIRAMLIGVSRLFEWPK